MVEACCGGGDQVVERAQGNEMTIQQTKDFKNKVSGEDESGFLYS